MVDLAFIKWMNSQKSKSELKEFDTIIKIIAENENVVLTLI